MSIPCLHPTAGSCGRGLGRVAGSPVLTHMAVMLPGKEAPRVSAAVRRGGRDCSPSLPTSLGHSGSSLAQPLAWLGNS